MTTDKLGYEPHDDRPRAITLWEPWASLLARGIKRVETRAWTTRYRGPLLVHASKRPMRPAEWNDELRSIVRSVWGCDVPQLETYGHIIGIVDVVNVRSTDDFEFVGSLSVVERACGNYSEGRYGWVCDDAHALASTARVRTDGKRMLWTPHADAAWALPEWVRVRFES